jgi:WD40 repeat protein
MGTLRFNAGRAELLTLSPDGQFLATSRLGVIEIWDREGRRATDLSLPGDHSHATALVFSPDASRLFVGMDRQDVACFKVQNGQLTWKRGLSAWSWDVEWAAFSTDGQRIAVSFESEKSGVAILDAATGSVLQEVDRKFGDRPLIDWFPDGETLALANDPRLWVVPLQNPAGAREVELPTKYARPFVLANEGHLFVLGDGDDRIRVLDAQTAKPVLTIDAPWRVRQFALDGARKTLFVFLRNNNSSEACAVRVYDLPQRKLLREFTIDIATPNTMRSATVTPDGQFLVTGTPEVRWWSAQDGKPQAPRERHAARIRKLIFDPSGSTLYSLGFVEAIRAWDTKTGQCRMVLPLSERNASFSKPITMALAPEGQWLATSDQGTNLSIVNTQTWQVSTRGESEFGGHDMVFAPDGKTLILWTYWLMAFDVENGKSAGKPRKFKEAKATQLESPLAQSPDGRWLVVNGKKVQIYDLQKLEEWQPGTPRPSPACPVAFSPDSKCIVFGFDEKRKQFLTWCFQEEKFPWQGVQLNLPPIAISSQGLWAICEEVKRDRRIYSIRMGRWGTNEILREFRGHRAPVTALTFSPDGRYLASGDQSGEILIWDTQSPATRKLGGPSDEF